MKSFRISINIAFLLSIVFLLLTSCSIAKTVSLDPPEEEIALPELSILDGGLLSGVPCSAPCFWGITPGITPIDEAIDKLSQIGDFEECEKWDKKENGVDKGVRCSNIGITFNDQEIVSRLSFHPANEITLSELIQIYGDPNEVSVTAFGTDLEGPLSMLLMYHEEMMIVGFPTQDTDQFDLQPTLVISNVQYCENEIFMRFINDSNDPWKGY